MKNKIKISAGNKEIQCDIYSAETFYERLKGLMFSFEKYGLFLENCNSIHTCFMKFNLDVICLDRDFKIIKIFHDVKPFKFICSVKDVKYILEIPSSFNTQDSFQSGMFIKIEK
ncbi:MAG: DUF192 domain-containing protein [Endomicrobiaceae bacterium]|nr:DUF192 domain-containing protein [Endomicrobiaceae bacterium]